MYKITFYSKSNMKRFPYLNNTSFSTLNQAELELSRILKHKAKGFYSDRVGFKIEKINLVKKNK